jgi:hypothetical protein
MKMEMHLFNYHVEMIRNCENMKLLILVGINIPQRNNNAT